MKITLPKTKSSHLLLKRDFESLPRLLISYKLWTVDQKFRAFFSDPQKKSRCRWKGCFKYQQTGIWQWFPTCRRTPGAQVPLLLATLQSRVILQWSSRWRGKSVNTPGILILFHVIVFWLCEKSPSMTSSRPLGTSWRVVFWIKAKDSLRPTQLRGKTTIFKPFGTRFRG